MLMQKFYQNIPLSSRDRAIFTFSEFEPQQRLGQSQMTFDNLLGYILSISMHLQSFKGTQPRPQLLLYDRNNEL